MTIVQTSCMYFSLRCAARDQDILFVLPVQKRKKKKKKSKKKKNINHESNSLQFFTVFQKFQKENISHKVPSIKSRTYVQQIMFHVLLRNLLD